MAKREKKPVHKVIMTEGKRNIIRQLLKPQKISRMDSVNSFAQILKSPCSG